MLCVMDAEVSINCISILLMHKYLIDMELINAHVSYRGISISQIQNYLFGTHLILLLI